MPFLDRTIARNPKLIEAAVALHQSGQIPANTFLLDQDVFIANMTTLKDAADDAGLSIYFMTKQHGRNPLAYRPGLADRRASTVAVDIQCARALYYNGLGLGHVGNLCQIPVGDLDRVVGEMRPEVVSVFSLDKAAGVSASAVRAGRVQDILLRVRRDGDLVLPGMAGGFHIEELAAAVRAVKGLEGVRIVGVTTFPAMDYRHTDPVAAPNFDTLRIAAAKLEDLGVSVQQVNAPGNTSADVMAFMRERGATHVEPGSAVSGHSTYHLAHQEFVELPGLVYVSEISHFVDGKAWVFGGGLWLDDPPVAALSDIGRWRNALVGRDANVLERKVRFLGTGSSATGSFGGLDYHGLLDIDRSSASVGDTVVFAFRTQAFDTRANVAVVRNCAQHPELLGLFDVRGHPLDPATWW
jgi:predicted amino acid racemase